MNVRERFKAVMTFQPVDRIPAIESYWWWDKTLARWYAEGLPRDLAGHAEIADYLGLDTHRIVWLAPRVRFTPPSGRCQDGSVVRDLADYEEFIRPILEGPTFDAREIAPFIVEQHHNEVFLWIQLTGFFWFPRELLGIERHLMAFYDEAELMHRMNRDLATYTLRLLDDLFRVCEPDLISFGEDMSYNKGPMISRGCFDDFIVPYYHQVLEPIRRRGIPTLMDSDGEVTKLAGWLQEIGIDGVTPIERRAGNDIHEIRHRYPHLRMLGGFDKTVMHLGEQAIREEFERILPVMRSGGYIPSVDHQTPPEVSLRDYLVYVPILREYCEKAAQSADTG